MLSLCRLIVRPQRVASIVAATNRRNLLLTSVVMRNQRASEPSALLSCLITLRDMVSSQDSECSPRESPLFQAVSKKIVADLNSFTLNQIVQVLGVAGQLEVECSSPMVQECCQVLAPRLEKLDLRQLNRFSRALHQFRGTSALTESLMSSSTKVFESQVEKLDLSEFKICFRAIEFAVRVNLKQDKRDLVIDAGREELPRAHPFHALALLCAVAFEGCEHIDPEDHKIHALLKDCLTVITKNLSTFDSYQVQELMTAYSKINIVERELHDALWSLAPSWSLDEIMQLVNLSLAKDAFSSKDAETLRILLEAGGEKVADARDTAETITEKQSSLLDRSINRCQSKEQLWDLIQQNLHDMNSQLLFRCICRYGELAMIEARIDRGFTAADDPYFKQIASTAVSKLDSPNFHQCSVLLKIAKKLKLDDSHFLVRRVLEGIPPLIPDMDLNQISILSNRMKLIKGESPLKNDCLLTARLAFERLVKEKLDRTNEKQCLSALEFVLRYDSSIEIQDTVIDAAQGFLAHAPLTTTAQMIYSLAYNKSAFVAVENPKVRNLAENCLTKLAQNLNNFDYKTVSRIMGAYQRVDVFSNELNDAFWSRAASLPFDEAISMLINIPLRKIRLKDAEHFKQLLAANKYEVPSMDVVPCSSVMALLALSSPGLHSDLGEIGLLFAKALSRTDLRINIGPMLADFVTSLVILGAFPEQELDYLFSKENQRKVLSRTPEAGAELIRLERLLRSRFGESRRYALLPELRERVAVQQKRLFLDQDLVHSVGNALGGAQFLSLKVITPIGSAADLLVAKSSDGNLIDLSGKKSPLEDLADGTRVVGLLQCFRHNYHDDLEMRKMSMLLREHFLRVQNICPVEINMVKWKSLPSGEKDSFVMRKIEDAMREAPPRTSSSEFENLCEYQTIDLKLNDMKETR